MYSRLFSSFSELLGLLFPLVHQKEYLKTEELQYISLL